MLGTLSGQPASTPPSAVPVPVVLQAQASPPALDPEVIKRLDAIGARLAARDAEMVAKLDALDRKLSAVDTSAKLDAIDARLAARVDDIAAKLKSLDRNLFGP